MAIIYFVCIFITLIVTFIGNEESWVRKINLKVGAIPESNVFKDTTPYWIIMAMLSGIAYVRGLIV